MLEAARTDGATEWQVFRRVTVPLLAPILSVVFITMLINVLKVFDIVISIAPGSTQADANVIALAMWRTSFGGVNDFGVGSAIAVFLFLLVLPVLALLNVLGQNPTTSEAAGSVGKLRVEMPQRLRGGLMFQVRIDVEATHDIKEPQLVLSPGLLEQLTLNTIEPDPLSQSNSNGRLTLSYGRIPAGQRLTVWLEYQANPANAGTQTANVSLTDGATPVATVHRDITILP